MASGDCRCSDRVLIAVGALLGLLAVVGGTFAAHWLGPSLNPKDLNTFEVAARYQMYHALAIFCAAWLSSRSPGRSGDIAIKAGWMFVVGCVLFSGSLYLLVLTGAKWLGMVAPIGGASFLVGWALLGISALMSDGGADQPEGP
jgi:uncharacterized membrane protein YgdD (TMEM256/DUF423 family)